MTMPGDGHGLNSHCVFYVPAQADDDIGTVNGAVASAVADLSICIPAIGIAALFCAIAGRAKNTRIAVSKSVFM